MTEPSSSGGAKHMPLVLIQRGSSAPFFCVHGAGGNVLNFRDIARRLGPDQTFYGLQAQGVDGAQPLETIEEMAALYLPDILSANPRGPYLLGGYSGGGVVAYEIAQRLAREGREVALVVFLDTISTTVKPLKSDAKKHLGGIASLGPRYLYARARARAVRFGEELGDELKKRFYASQGQPLPFELRDQVMTAAFWRASDRYVARPYAGPVVLYRASEVGALFLHADENLGWTGLIDRLEVVEVPGNHDSLVYEPNVSVITAHLKKRLREAAASPRSAS